MPRIEAAFYFDLANPFAYLAAERALQVLAGGSGPVPWQPVLASGLPGGESFALRCEHEEQALREDVERRARALGLAPLRWPEPFPFDSSLAMRVASYARSIGRAVPFAQAAFRQAFAGGHSLEDPDYVVIAAAACEMHPAAVLRAAETRSVAAELERATGEAAQAGVQDVPAVLAGDGAVFCGEHELERAGEHLRALAGSEAAPKAGPDAAPKAGSEQGP
jgi:2-hydroxychromene-2-carboxylate isomerase